jgi:hypothetical protein
MQHCIQLQSFIAAYDRNGGAAMENNISNHQ